MDKMQFWPGIPTSKEPYKSPDKISLATLCHVNEITEDHREWSANQLTKIFTEEIYKQVANLVNLLLIISSNFGNEDEDM